MEYDCGGVNINKLFDDKVPLSQNYQFDGNHGGDAWRIKVRGYWIGKCPALLPILDWTEKQDANVITLETLSAKIMEGQCMTELNIPRLSQIIWSFLNICLKDTAITCFSGAETLNGLDGWRRVVNHIQHGRNTRLAILRKVIKNPPAIRKLEDVTKGIMVFENTIREYEAVGGTAPSESEQKQDLLETLPLEIRENLLWRASED